MWTRQLCSDRSYILAEDFNYTFSALTEKYLNEGGSFQNCLKKYLTELDSETLLTKCSKCTCCERHQVNRPKKMTDNPDISQYLSDRQNSNCDCACRHFSRWLCRSFSNSFNN